MTATQVQAAPPRTPRFCPWCKSETLKETCGAGFIEKGCWNGKTYCYEGDLPGYVCTVCGASFSVDLDEDEIHSSCDCKENRDCECGRYEAAQEMRVDADAAA